MDWLGGRISSPNALLPLLRSTKSREVKAHRAAIEAYVREVIARRRRSSENDDTLTELLAAKPSGSALTGVQLCGHVAGLIGAGNEVTAAMLSWALVYGAQRPDLFASMYSRATAIATMCATKGSVTRRKNGGRW